MGTVKLSIYIHGQSALPVLGIDIFDLRESGASDTCVIDQDVRTLLNPLHQELSERLIDFRHITDRCRNR